jgi:lipoyl(octanoyl) transferase
MSKCEVRDIGRTGYAEAFELQRLLVERRKRGEVPNQLVFVEHPHVITVGRNGHEENVLASAEVLRGAGIELCETDRGGDVTYHGPGQVVGYPIFDLREWKRDVVAYVRVMEQAIIDTLAGFGIEAGRMEKATGVWVGGAKIAAIGVHISRWVTSHGFALNVSTDLRYFQYIVPCGLTKPVTSMRALGCDAPRNDVLRALTQQFAAHFALEVHEPEETPLSAAALLMERVT